MQWLRKYLSVLLWLTCLFRYTKICTNNTFFTKSKGKNNCKKCFYSFVCQKFSLKIAEYLKFRNFSFLVPVHLPLYLSHVIVLPIIELTWLQYIPCSRHALNILLKIISHHHATCFYKRCNFDSILLRALSMLILTEDGNENKWKKTILWLIVDPTLMCRRMFIWEGPLLSCASAQG